MDMQCSQTLEDLLATLGRCGERLAALQSCEGAAGNLSIFFRLADLNKVIEDRFPIQLELDLPVPAPALAGGACLVTGSGQRLRDIAADPTAALGVILIGADGRTGTLHTARRCGFRRVTSEFNSHLAVYQTRIAQTGGEKQAVVHVQPRHVTYLSHIPAYQDFLYFNRRLLRWQPEMILQFPKGIAVLPFLPPASPALAQASAKALEERPLVVWSRHGILARADEGMEQAVDLVEYLEAAANDEFMNLLAGEPAGGLGIEEMGAICEMYGVRPEILERLQSGEEKEAPKAR